MSRVSATVAAAAAAVVTVAAAAAVVTVAAAAAAAVDTVAAAAAAAAAAAGVLAHPKTVMAAGAKIVLPSDAVVATEFKSGAVSQNVPVDSVSGDQMILDVGPATASALADRLTSCRTLVWNGPMGAFELRGFDHGTNTVARAAADLTDQGTLLSVAGGGDTVAALAHAGALEHFTYVSTAGGAFLEWLEGKTLPGVAALES